MSKTWAQMTAALVMAGTGLLLLARLAGSALPVGELAALPLGPNLALDIYLLDTGRGLYVNRTASRAWDGELALSPDGRWLAYASFRTGNGDVFVQGVYEGEPQQLTRHFTYDGEPAWSPDGRLIAFTAWRDGQSEIYRMTADGADQRRLTMNAGMDISADWSPDGRWLAFVSSRAGDPADIYVMDADGGSVQRVTGHPGFDLHPAWSPDGRRLAFVSNRDGNLQIYSMVVDCLGQPAGCAAENPRQLTRHGIAMSNLWWTADGEAILYLDDRPGAPELFTVAVDCDVTPACAPRRLTYFSLSLRLLRR